MIAVYVARFATMSRAEVLRSDYLPLDAAGHILRAGLGGQLYVDGVQGPIYAALSAGDHTGDLLFNHAPISAFLAVPFSLLGPTQGHALWSLVQLAMVAVGCVFAARGAPWPKQTSRAVVAATVLVALAGAGTLPLLLEGQGVGEITLGLGAAYWLWRRGHLGLGAWALVMGAAVAKPHLALGLTAFLLGWRERRLLLGVVAGAVTAIGLSVLIVGGDGVVGFLQTAVRSTGLFPAAQQLGFTGFFATLFGQGVPADVASVVCIVLALAGCVVLGGMVRHDPSKLEFALMAACALSLASAPHLLNHDLVLLAPMLVITVAAAARREAGMARWPGRTVRAALQLWVLLLIAAGADSTLALPIKLTPVVLVVFAWSGWRWLRPIGIPTHLRLKEASSAATVSVS
jgi:hypothetical protein